jgi:GalNAc5-diNAcBac-PP-undecaprenol beta-1,3-glucosyltransferase
MSFPFNTKLLPDRDESNQVYYSAMTDSLFTIIIPTFNHEETLRYSIQSVLDQTVKDFELHVIGDGATEKTEKIVQEFAKDDSRIRYHNFPKSARTGEEYRAKLLSEVRSRYVCYLSDDDLWFPDHLQIMQSLLASADFAYTFSLMIKPDGNIDTWYGDYTHPFYKKIFLHTKNNRYNVIPLSCAGHTLSAYKRLPRGWESTPVGKHTDLHMWQVFVSEPTIKISKSPTPTVLHFASSLRKEASGAERIEELSSWYKRLKQNPQALRLTVLEGALTAVYGEFLHFRSSMHSTKAWRLLEAVRNFIGIKR